MERRLRILQIIAVKQFKSLWGSQKKSNDE